MWDQRAHDVSDHGVRILNLVSYHNAINEGDNLHQIHKLHRHHVTIYLEVSDSDIFSSLENYDAIRQMLATFGWGAPMSDEHG